MMKKDEEARENKIVSFKKKLHFIRLLCQWFFLSAFNNKTTKGNEEVR